MLSVLRRPALIVVSLGHLTVDMFSASLPILLVVFAARLGLSNAGIGTVATIYTLCTSLSQPLFGIAADRWNSRWLNAGAIVWQAGCFVLATILPGYAALAAFALAALGSGAYHPHGSLNIRHIAGDQAATGTSIFFFFGLAGHALGPVLVGLLLARVSLTVAVSSMAALIVPIVLLVLFIAPAGHHSEPHGARQAAAAQQMEWAPYRLAAFLLVFFCFAWPLAATTTFFPKWLSDAGFSSSAFGALLGVFSLASAFGGIAGGALADRWSRKWVIVLSLVLAAGPFYLLYLTPAIGISAFITMAVAGFAIGMPQSVMIVMGQNLFPRNLGFGSGLVLGFFFTVTAIAAWINGWLADLIGLHQTLLLAPWLCLLAATIALLLPRTRSRSLAVNAPAT